MPLSPRPLLMLLPLLAAGSAPAQQETGLLRFPAIHGDQVVFTYAGDLFTISQTGGIARRLTSDAGYEMFARFSPDGQSIAFTGQYDGNTEVYLMPAVGGVPERLTTTATLERDDVSDCIGPNNIVMAWKDNNTVVYRSRQREADDVNGQLFMVPREGGPSRQLPLPRGGCCSFAPDGKRMAYNRVFGEFCTCRRSRGGQTDDIWIHDFDTKTTINITNNPAQDVLPMWAGTKIYFVSDRGDNQRMNLYAYDTRTQQVRTITSFTDYDIKFPSIGNTAIIFENGGFLYTMALGTEQVRKLTIAILEDFDSGRGGLRDVSRDITSFEIAPGGSRALFGARGDLFTVPERNGTTRNLTNTPGTHERNPQWSPDGRWIVYITDGSGEEELCMMAQDGSGQAVQLTTGGNTYTYQPLWSPDSRKLLWADSERGLRYVDVQSGQTTMVARSTGSAFPGYTWSPDSRWIAYALPDERRMSKIRLYSVEEHTTVEVTDGRFMSAEPAFSADGKMLFFVSTGPFTSLSGLTGWNRPGEGMPGISLVILAKGTPPPFGPKSDEAQVKEDQKEAGGQEGRKNEDTGTGKKKKGGVTVRVDPDGLQERIAVLPIPASGYRNLRSVGGRLFYVRTGRRDEKPRLLSFDCAQWKETDLGEAGAFRISADGKSMIVGTEGAYVMLDLPGFKIDMRHRLNLNDMHVMLDRHAEWNQIFAESWRLVRNIVRTSNMHGVDLPALRRKYGTLLQYVNHRADLTYIISEMIGEVNAGHVHVRGGDHAGPWRVPTGLLGAQIERDRTTGYFRINRILKGQSRDRALRSPLAEIGVDVHEGDYLLAVNGKRTSTMNDVSQALINTVGKQVVLEVHSKPEDAGSRSVVVVPIGDERPLYYYDWVQENIRKVDEATGSKVGYVHIPDIEGPGLNEFVSSCWPQRTKEGLIVDLRGYGGGTVSSKNTDGLRCESAMAAIALHALISCSPGGVEPGPRVLLLNEFSGTGGDAVAYRFKKCNLGSVVGRRSRECMGGILRSLPLLDGGTLDRTVFPCSDPEGRAWGREGSGVDPDIELDNDPAREYAGIDDQLNKAIEWINEELKMRLRRLPPPPRSPGKSENRGEGRPPAGDESGGLYVVGAVPAGGTSGDSRVLFKRISIARFPDDKLEYSAEQMFEGGEERVRTDLPVHDREEELICPFQDLRIHLTAPDHKDAFLVGKSIERVIQ
jgi:tricorn protease